MRRRYARLRQAGGRVLEGTVIRYGDVARAPETGRERFLPGAFGDVARADVILNSMHVRARPLARTGGSGLTLTDTREALTMRAELPRTRDCDDVLTLVRAGVLRGLSVEYEPVREHPDNGVMVIAEAALGGLGVVDRPAFPASGVRARQRPADTRITGTVQLGQDLACRCRKNCSRIRIEAEAFDGALAEAVAGQREVTAFFSGSFDRPIASVSSGTLRLAREGDVLRVAVSQLPDTSPVRDFLAGLAAARFTYRPYFPDDTSRFRVEGETAIFTEADLRAVEIAPLTGPMHGLTEIDVSEAAQPVQRRRLRVWL